MKYDVIPENPENRKRVRSSIRKALKKGDAAFTAHINSEHHKAFERIDCLQCGNCCSKHSPILLQTDLERIANHTGISMTELLTEKVEMDEDGDFVFQQQPCPFLGADLHCSIYAFRPDACADFPHSDRANQSELSDILEENAFVCPVISHIIKSLEEINSIR